TMCVSKALVTAPSWVGSVMSGAAGGVFAGVSRDSSCSTNRRDFFGARGTFAGRTMEQPHSSRLEESIRRQASTIHQVCHRAQDYISKALAAVLSTSKGAE